MTHALKPQDLQESGWASRIKDFLDSAVAGAYIASGLRWYPVQGRTDLYTVPTVAVVLGRPRRRRDAYWQWQEGGVAPQVVFEIWSMTRTLTDAVDKFRFYDQHGVQEYYLYNPEDGYLAGWCRHDGHLVEIPKMDGHRSPLLGIRFWVKGQNLQLQQVDDEPDLSYTEMTALLDQERERADKAECQAARLAAKLRELGIDPDAV